MHESLIGYLLNALDVEQTLEVQRILDVDSEARRRLGVLRTGLAPLEGDRNDSEAPSRLSVRTCLRIRALHDLRERR